jgi:hypothetical protein
VAGRPPPVASQVLAALLRRAARSLLGRQRLHERMLARSTSMTHRMMAVAGAALLEVRRERSPWRFLRCSGYCWFVGECRGAA